MRILALETSEYISSLALVENGRVLAHEAFPSRMNLCESLTRRIGTLVGETPLCDGALDGLAVSLGPGSFTGLRVGVATAKALAHACGLPLLGIATQQVIAAGAGGEESETVCVVQRARKDQVYAGLWQVTAKKKPRALGGIEVVDNARIAEFIGNATRRIVGPAAENVYEVLSGETNLQFETVMPDARDVGVLAAGVSSWPRPEESFAVRPVYILPSQAERLHNIDVTTGPESDSADEPKLVVRRATLDDLAEIVRIECASFATPWDEETLREEMSNERLSVYLVAVFDGRIVGYIGAWVFAGEVHICTLAVEPDHRRLGIGEILVVTLLQEALGHDARRALLEYRVSNEAAAGLYGKLGFTYLHLRRGYYSDTGEDAVVAVLEDMDSEAVGSYLRECMQKRLEEHGHTLIIEL